MNIRNFLIAAAITTVATTGFALTPEHTAWGNGPVQHLMTKEETAKWKAVKSDEAAEAFIALFWAKRDPSPGTPRNEFHDDFDRRVKAADDQFPGPKGQPGSMTDRGKTLILYGMPKRIERAGTQRAAALPSGISEDPANQPMGEDNESLTWIYEDETAKTFFGTAKATVRFVDRHGKSDFKYDRGGSDLGAAQKRAIELAVVQPNLTEAPKFVQAPVAPPEPVIQTELTTPELKSAVDAFKAGTKSDKQIFASYGEFVTADGEYFVPVLLYVPKTTGLTAGQKLTFFGLVEDGSGKSVLAFEDPVALGQSKDDLFVDKSLKLGAGKHRGIFGLADAGKPVAIVNVEMNLAGSIDKTAPGTSPLILANNIYPLPAAQAPTDPFAFGGLKVIPKSDHKFRTSDELLYFVELRNPGIPEPAPVAEGAPAAAPGTPKVQVKLDVEGEIKGQKIKRPAPLMEVDALPVTGVPGHYFLGSPIPLASFKPGDYTFTVKVIDTVRKTSYTLSDKFTVVE